MIVQLMRGLFKTLRIDPHDFLFSIFEVNSKRVLDRKISGLSFELQKLVLDEDEKYHYGDSELNETASQNVVRSFSIDRIRFIQNILKNTEIKTVVDIGDSNGLFIRSLGKTGICVNISDQTTKGLKQKNLEVIRADIEYLPFRRESIDLVLSFETLEHVKNPVRALEEIGRVCKQSSVVSVPYVEKTYVNRAGNMFGDKYYLHHIFEFCPSDFKNIVNLSPFTLACDERAVVLDGKISIFHHLIFSLWNRFVERDTYCGCFKEFYLCHLFKKKGMERALCEYR